MAPTVDPTRRADLLLTAETRAAMAKADLRKAEHVGRAIQRAQLMCGWSLKEFADAARRNERQIARWIAGTEHSQLDTLFAIEAFRQPLIVALAELAGLGVDVETVITIRRAA